MWDSTSSNEIIVPTSCSIEHSLSCLFNVYRRYSHVLKLPTFCNFALTLLTFMSVIISALTIRPPQWHYNRPITVSLIYPGLFVARRKLGIRGNKLVLEEDGTEIDKNNVLHEVLESNCVLLLLCDGENYKTAEGILRPPSLLVTFIGFIFEHL